MGILRRLAKTPSLKPELGEPDWRMDVLDDATAKVASEAGLSRFPEACPWSPENILADDWLPE